MTIAATTSKLILRRLGLSLPEDLDDNSMSNGCTIAPRNGAILAYSVFKPDASVDRIIYASDSGRKLLSDQKTPFEQFQPKRLVTSTMRVVATQTSMTLSYFFTDQLESEMKTEQLVKDGTISAEEADKMNEEWEDREWSQRWSGLQQRCVHAVIKYQATTLMMRFYEYVIAKYVDAVTMDKLTKDPFKASLRTANVTGPNSKEIVKPMFETCLWSNAVAFLSDYTVHQIILAFTYYMYCRERRHRMILEREQGDESSDEDTDDHSTGAIAMTFGLKSCKLLVSRSLGLVATGAGGAYGSYLYPGWGCTIGSSLGDALMSTALEERTSS